MRPIGRSYIGQRSRAWRDIAKDVHRNAARRARDRRSADDSTAHVADRIDRRIVPRGQRNVVDVDGCQVATKLSIGVVFPFAAQEIDSAVHAQHGSYLFAHWLHIDKLGQLRVRRAELKAGDRVGNAGSLDRGRNIRVVALDRQVRVLECAWVWRTRRTHPRHVDRHENLIAAIHIVRRPSISVVTIELGRKAGAVTDVSRQVTAFAEWRNAVSYCTCPRRPAIRSIIECEGYAVRAECSALQRARRDQTVFGKLIILPIQDPRDLWRSGNRVGNRANLKTGCGIPCAAIRPGSGTKTIRRYAAFVRVFGAKHQMQSIVSELATPCQLSRNAFIVAIICNRAEQVAFESRKFCISNQIDDAGNCV